jgi:hypothetical protein
MRSYLNHTFVKAFFTVLPVLTAAGALIGAVGAVAARIRAAFGPTDGKRNEGVRGES